MRNIELVFRALGREPRGNSRIDQIPAFMDAKNLQSLISSDLQCLIKRVYSKSCKLGAILGTIFKER